MSKNVLSLIAKGNYHLKNGITTKTIFKIDKEFFENLKKECLDLAASEAASKVEDRDHITNWVGPFGDAVQFSLYNTTGSYNDYSTDHNLDIKSKKFHYAEKFPTIDKFIKMFPDCTNFRLNGMGKNSGLSPHEEHIVFNDQKNKSNFVRARFHLPIMTNEKVEMLLDRKLYRYKEGEIYFFNNGAVHSANNKGETYRFHLLWDMIMTKKAYDLMFNEEFKETPKELKRVDFMPEVTGTFNYKTFQTYGPAKSVYEKLKLKNIGLKLESFAKLYNILKSITSGKIDYAKEN
ncbi:aspartyl/asparaginyl beta-hydroxylase domain-containing protein [Aquimarina sp. I32.4]|uniref:aspartyl/asparaginyl beta-hydroxylase domain-containing protein n=1 Tax=Aquimarina sp. I32.4 TaxID=2053903 RepID=UPI000CDF0DC7|nr:aspartyl/asparaginyl beta-hydroxylase domain-containing protein [Aquimarina sp. I32.4]